MAMRITGLMSGMDTESIIKELVAVKRTKVDDAKRAQKRLQWKQDAWKDLNSQIMKLYNNTLNKMRFSDAYSKKITKVSNPNAVSVITGVGAMNGVQGLQIRHLAKSSMLTGARLNGSSPYNSDTKLTDPVADGGMGLAVGSEIEVSAGGKTTRITIDENTTMKGFVTALNNAGVNASFDEVNQRFYIGAKESGVDNDFHIYGMNVDGNSALDSLGISYYGDGSYYQDIIDGAADKKTNMMSARLTYLTGRRSIVEDKKTKLTEMITDTYADKFVGVNVNNKNDVEARINSLAATDPDAYAALANWKTDMDAVDDELSQLTQTGVDSDGNPTYDLSAAEKQRIIDEVDADVAFAQSALTAVNNGTLTGTAVNKEIGKDAEITLNGVAYTSSTNTFTINGLTLTVNAETQAGETITVTTMDDTDGLYDMIKGFIKEYNGLVNQMDKLYNADSSKGYEPLTDEEKEAMSESEIEEWEKKIKDSILRKDSTMSTFSGAIKAIMAEGVMVNGERMYLSDFGIETQSYFTAPENEKNAYHIDGDSDDEVSAGKEDKLKSMIASDPNTVIEFFTNLSRSLYSKVTELSAGSEYSSTYSIYDDKKMKEDYDDYTAKIKDLEKKLSDYEDKWYAKFASMETAIARLQKNASAVTSLLGGS